MELENKIRDEGIADTTKPMAGSDDVDQSAQQVDTGGVSTITTVEAPSVEQFAFHLEDELNRTFEVVQETYIQVSRVKLSHGTTLEDDHKAPVQIECAFATQHSQFQEYVKQLESQFQSQILVRRGELAAMHSEVERLGSGLGLTSSTLSSRAVIIGELQETIKQGSEVKKHDDRELLTSLSRSGSALDHR